MSSGAFNDASFILEPPAIQDLIEMFERLGEHRNLVEDRIVKFITSHSDRSEYSVDTLFDETIEGNIAEYVDLKFRPALVNYILSECIRFRGMKAQEFNTALISERIEASRDPNSSRRDRGTSFAGLRSL